MSLCLYQSSFSLSLLDFFHVSAFCHHFPPCSTSTCQLFHRLGLCHIYLPLSVTLVQAVVILVAHHLLPPELPAPAMSSPSSFPCCPLVLCYLCFTPRLISQCLCWCIHSVVLVWCFVDSQRLVSTKFPLLLGVPSRASATASSAVSPIQHSS